MAESARALRPGPGEAAAARSRSAQSAARTGEQRLILAWLSLATLAIGLATLYAIVLVAARTPQLAALLPQGDLFHTALVLHVDLAAVIWFFAVAGALWNLVAPRGPLWVRWTAFGMGAAGMAAVALSPLLAPGAPIPNNYVPVLDSPLFLSGLSWFFVGATLAALGALVPAPGGSPPLLGALRLAALLALAAFVALGVSAATLPAGIDRGLHFELLNWAPGHIAQFAFTLLMLVAWLVLAAALGLPAPGRRLLGAAYALAVLPLLPALLLLALYPPDAVVFRKGYTALMAFGTWPAPLLVGGWLVAGLLRRRAAPDPGGARATLWLSLLLFAAGCVLGAFIRTDSTLVPAHYHGTVGGVTLALMGLLLHFAWRLRADPPPDAARWLPWVYGGGLALMVGGLAWLAAEGGARKTPLTGATESAGHLAASSLTGLGGLLAIAGGVLFVALAGRALWRRGAPLIDPASLLQEQGGTPATRSARHRDVRPRALLLTAGAVVLLGLILAWQPDAATLRSAVARSLAGFAPVDKPSHAADKRREEIDLRFAQGIVMLHAKQHEHAVTAFHRVIELAPEMPEAHVNMGFALIGLERFGAARDFFETAIALRTEQLNAYYGLAEALEGLGDLPGAIGAMRSYVHLAPPDDPFRRKGEAALWEWQDRLARERAAAGPAPQRP